MIGRDAASCGIRMPPLEMSVPPIVHGGVEPFPGTLGALHDQFERRGTPFITLLADQIRGRCRSGQFEPTASGLTLLVLSRA
jgi:hypothetical protein